METAAHNDRLVEMAARRVFRWATTFDVRTANGVHLQTQRRVHRACGGVPQQERGVAAEEMHSRTPRAPPAVLLMSDEVGWKMAQALGESVDPRSRQRWRHPRPVLVLELCGDFHAMDASMHSNSRGHVNTWL